MTVVAEWLERHTASAPAPLRARVLDHAIATRGTGELPVVLARAGREALEQVARHPGDRTVALDLLAADALITLALLAQAQDAPAELGAFAASMLRDVRPDP